MMQTITKTKEELLVEKLLIIAEMGDKQIETLANALIDYFGDRVRPPMGFSQKDDANEEDSSIRRRS